MGSVSSSFRSKETSICLDEDVFGKINNQSPNTAVPIEIKPKRRLNGGQKRVSLRGDSVHNRSSSFFSNLSSNKNNGSLVSFVSVNKSEYKRQNEKLKYELDDVKNKLSHQIQNLLTSNVTLKNQNSKLKSEIDQIKFSKDKIHEELLCALDNQLAMKENMQFYQQKVSELQNVITVQGTDSSHLKSVPNLELFARVLNNHIVTTFIEFMIMSQKLSVFELSSYQDVIITKKRIILFLCKSLDSEITSRVIDELLSLFAALISNFLMTGVILITSAVDEVRDKSSKSDFLVVLDGHDCSCSTGIEFVTGSAVHIIRYSAIKRQCPPMEEISKMVTIYNISEMALSAGLQLFVMNLWQCDIQSFSPLVFDYAFYFMQCKNALLIHKLSKIDVPNIVCHDFMYHLDSMRKSLYVSCSNSEAMLFVSHLQKVCDGELLIAIQVGAKDSYNDLLQKILASIFYQLKVESKYFTHLNEALLDIIDYLSLFFKVTIAILIDSSTLNSCVENFLISQKKSQSVCIIFGPSFLVKVIQMCDTIYLSKSHVPAMKQKVKMTTLRSAIQQIEREHNIEHCFLAAQFLTVFHSGLSDSCLKDLLGINHFTFYHVKTIMMDNKILTDEAGLIEIRSNFNPLELSQLPKKVTSCCLQHFVSCKNYHLHLNDLSTLFQFYPNLDTKNAVAKNPEALAYHVYNQKYSFRLIHEMNRYSRLDGRSLMDDLHSFYRTNYSSQEQVLIFRILAQLFYSEKYYYLSRYFLKLAQDLEFYFGFEPCFSSLALHAKLITERFRLSNAEMMLYDSCSFAIQNKLLDEAIKILLLHAGILKGMEHSPRSRKCLDNAANVFHHHTELIEIENIFGYCSLLSVINRSAMIDSVLQGLMSKLGKSNSSEVICMVLTSYASYHISNQKYNCALSLLEYAINAFKIQSDVCKKKCYRLLAVVYMKLGKYSDAINLYKVLLGNAILFQDLTDAHVFEDVYNYVVALIKINYFGSAYDIMKLVCEHYPGYSINSSHHLRINNLLKYLRSVISKCKPSSGHYRANVFLPT